MSSDICAPILQQVKDYILFGIVGTLVMADIIFLIPPTAISSARLRREDEEFEGNNVSVYNYFSYIQ